ncbi:MAG: PilZ domain-containing protein [Planctomycetota bacterium]
MVGFHDPLRYLRSSEGSGPERRGGGRIGMEGVKSNLGPVCDLSITGVRVRRRWFRPAEGKRVKLTITDGQHCVVIRGEVKRRDEDVHGKYVGIAFVDPTPDQQAAIRQLAESGRRKRTMPQAA